MASNYCSKFKNIYRIYKQQAVSSTCVLWRRGWGLGQTEKGAVLLGNTSITATIQNESQSISIKYVPCVGWSKPISNKEAVLFCLLCPGVGECECDLWLAKEQVLPAMSTSLARLKDFLLLTLCISIICKKRKSHTSNRGQIFKYCTCPAGRMTYNFHSSCKHMHLSFKSVCNKGVICNMTSSSNYFQSTHPTGRVLWEELLVLSRFHS